MRLVWLSVLCLPLFGWTQAQSPATGYKQLVDKIQPNIVTVRVVAKADIKAGEESESRESKFSLQGAVLTSDGLVMLSGIYLSTEGFKEYYGIEDDAEVSVTITPISFKVIFGSETKEYEAKLVATDSQLGLAFLKIVDLEGRTVNPLPLAEEPLTLGSEVITVSRLPRGFDYAPYYCTGRVISEVNKPRKAYLLEGSISEMGLPVYNAKGEIVGVMVSLRHGLKDEEVDIGFRNNFGSEDSALFLVPVSALKPLIEQARERAANTQ
ncbi:MAG: serine protease [Armatimonadota bacterium]|nr:serine protease [Armatimonadota bacterium]